MRDACAGVALTSAAVIGCKLAGLIWLGVSAVASVAIAGAAGLVIGGAYALAVYKKK